MPRLPTWIALAIGQIIIVGLALLAGAAIADAWSHTECRCLLGLIGWR